MSEQHDAPPIILADGKFLRFVRRSGWEYVERRGITGIVGIVAVTDDGKLLLVEQYRTPVNKRVIEIPAGLVGDEAGKEAESLLAAARRELQEETGYYAENLSPLASGPSSAGMSNEIISLWHATQLRKVGPGGGVEGEDILVHEVALYEARLQLDKWIAEGKLVDLKVYGALHFAAFAN